MSTLDTSPDGRRYGQRHLTEAEVRADLAAIADDEYVGITPEGQALGHRYVMGHVNAYCPKCSAEHSEREGRDITVLDCDYDLDK